ncbi:MAG: hypothetical protein Ta2A_19650 [Treponemataceae bacterium]|nr:MAG: hypothetical protein Ta2A_19650 [Treponemataceae bacterium]
MSGCRRMRRRAYEKEKQQERYNHPQFRCRVFDNIPMTMADWETRLNRFIEMFEYGLLKDSGTVSAEIAKLHALTEFEKYRIVQDRLYRSDFDRLVDDTEGEDE